MACRPAPAPRRGGGRPGSARRTRCRRRSRPCPGGGPPRSRARSSPSSRGDLDALAAAAGGRLHRHRVADRARRSRAPARPSPPARSRPGSPAPRPPPSVSRALIFDPIASIASGGGPTKTSPAAAQARAKPAFSARKPKPGCTASAPARSARAHDRLGQQVALGGRAGADQVRLVGVADEGRVAVGLASRPPPSRCPSRAACGRCGWRSRRGWRPAPSRTSAGRLSDWSAGATRPGRRRRLAMPSAARSRAARRRSAAGGSRMRGRSQRDVAVLAARAPTPAWCGRPRARRSAPAGSRAAAITSST